MNRFRNTSARVVKAGVPLETAATLRSNALAASLDADHPPARAHDGLDDARSVSYALRHFLGQGALAPEDFL